MTISHDRLTFVLDYNPDDGQFRWRNPTHSKYKVGDIAGSQHIQGYYGIKIDRVFYRRCRLAWFFVHREWPRHQLDHINRDKSDDRLANLRECTNAQNQWNTISKVNSKLGTKNVHFSKRLGKYVADIRVNGRTKHLGCFDTLAEAIASRNTAAMLIHGEFFRPVTTTE